MPTDELLFDVAHICKMMKLSQEGTTASNCLYANQRKLLPDLGGAIVNGKFLTLCGAPLSLSLLQPMPSLYDECREVVVISVLSGPVPEC